jgi:alpha-ketoglutaric semialdehyde dehydrogenase
MDITSTALILSGANFVGADRSFGAGGTFHAVDPRTGSELPPAFGNATDDDVRSAAALAMAAWPVYRSTSRAERAAFLETIAGNLDDIGDQLRPLVVAETGITPERVAGELTRTTAQLRLFADYVRSGRWLGVRSTPALPDRTPLPRPDIRTRNISLGPVAVFSASNFPLAFSVAGGDTASALAAGCPVIVKAHAGHPGTSELVASAVSAAVADENLPPAVFSLLHGPGETIGIALVTDPNVRAVGFTGSRRAGLALRDAVRSRPIPIPFYAEMSSTNPVFLLPGALESRPEQLAEGFFRSLSVGAGQLCTNPGLVFLTDGPGAERFQRAAIDRVASAVSQPMLNRQISTSYSSGLDRLSSTPNVTRIAAGVHDPKIAFSGAPALFSTDLEEFMSRRKLHDELFGAASLLVHCRTVDDFSTALRILEPQLTISVHMSPADHDVARGLRLDMEHKAGRIVYDDWPTGVEVCDAMVHGGPYPATSDGRTTSVGTLAMDRFLRPVAYQNCPAALLPADLTDV